MKTIPNFSNYQISPDGRIVNKKRNRRLHPYKNIHGYSQISLVDDAGKRRCTTVHRVLAETYLDNAQVKPQVNHRDGDKQNNHVANLEWATAQENVDHARQMGLSKPNNAVVYQLHPCKGGVGHVIFRVAGLEAAGFNPANVMNTIKKPLTPGGRRRHVAGYYPSRVRIQQACVALNSAA